MCLNMKNQCAVMQKSAMTTGDKAMRVSLPAEYELPALN